MNRDEVRRSFTLAEFRGACQTVAVLAFLAGVFAGFLAAGFLADIVCSVKP